MIRNRALRRSVADFKRHPWLHLISIATVTAALLILGGAFLCYRNFESLAEKTNPGVMGTAYLREALPEKDLGTLRDRIESLDGIQKVVFKSKSSIVEELQSFMGTLESGPIPGSELFPDVLEIEMKPGSRPEQVAGLKGVLVKQPEITEVDFSEDWLLQYRRVRQVLRAFGIVLMAAIIIGCSFIIANFMGMRHQSRREEIDIARLIGAKDRFIFTPFLWEGIIEGLIGASFALGILYFIRSVLSTIVTVQWASLLGVHGWLFLNAGQVLLVMVIGIAMAIFGSITVFLRFQEPSTR